MFPPIFPDLLSDKDQPTTSLPRDGSPFPAGTIRRSLRDGNAAKESRELGESWRGEGERLKFISARMLGGLEFERFHFGNERFFSILSKGWGISLDLGIDKG